jgi:hypothetical protein
MTALQFHVLIQIELKFAGVEKVAINDNRMTHLKNLIKLTEVIEKSLYKSEIIHRSQVVDHHSVFVSTACHSF